MTIGERIKIRREELGLSQTELAKRMGLSAKSTICKLETQGDNITTDRIRRVADALNCSIAYLMGWDNEVQEIFEREVDARLAAGIIAQIKDDKELLENALVIHSLPRNKQEQIYEYINFVASQFLNKEPK